MSFSFYYCSVVWRAEGESEVGTNWRTKRAREGEEEEEKMIANWEEGKRGGSK